MAKCLKLAENEISVAILHYFSNLRGSKWHQSDSP